jgi:hypothetical protein
MYDYSQAVAFDEASEAVLNAVFCANMKKLGLEV